MKTLEQLTFDSRYLQLGDEYYSRVVPSPPKDPYLVAFNPDAAQLIDLNPAEGQRREFLEVFSGAKMLPGFDPIAEVYAGHQFGMPVPRLGDGRAILLGEARASDGAHWDLHLKGSGQTPYSRQGDGRAVLRSVIREYLCGEAMHGLGIPSTRSLCIIGSDDPVYRESVETRALLVRMAPSHVRFGTFEYFVFRYHRHPEQMREFLTRLADRVIEWHYPELSQQYSDPRERYSALLREVSIRTARMIAQWQGVGWTHGVMNTDNFSILGLTLDYGPYGFMEEFNPQFIPNHSDELGRYAFSQQPKIGLWNLNILAQALEPIIENDELIVSALQIYEPTFHADFANILRAKLGWETEQPFDEELIIELFTTLAMGRADYPNFFRKLSDLDSSQLEALFATSESRTRFHSWMERYLRRLAIEDSASGEGARQRKLRMDRVNPKFVLRSYLAQKAIEKAQQKDFSEIERLRQLLRDPFDERQGQSEWEPYAAVTPDWGRNIALSCSS